MADMFRRSQRIYDAIYAWKDYPTEAERIDAAIRERRPDATTLLDVACGTGKHLELLRDRYRVEGVDLDRRCWRSLAIAWGRGFRSTLGTCASSTWGGSSTR
jgi:predicted TPR repeat methyltransferase